MQSGIILTVLSLTCLEAALINFGGICKCELGYSALAYVGYGCYCGVLGSGRTVDGIDECCKTHDDCYRAAKRGKCTTIGLYMDSYKWECNNHTAVCRGKTDCEKALCACDLDAVRCWARYPKPSSKKKC